jgi:hypothetical protein
MVKVPTWVLVQGGHGCFPLHSPLLEIPTEQQTSVASNWPRKPFVQVQKYPDLVLNALTLYNCNCHGVGGTEKKEGTPNTQSTNCFSLTNWDCSILKQKLHLDKEETHSLIHVTSCSDFELDINLRLMMDQRILDFLSWAIMMVANSKQ